MSPEASDIAVVITSHNYGRFLKDCLDSVSTQTLKPAQVLVIDDSSVDMTASVVQEFPEVSYYKVEFGNGNKSRNYGFSKITAEWVVFFDADNFMLPNFLECLYSAITDDISFVYCDRINFGDGDVSWYGDPLGVWSSQAFDVEDLKRGNYVDLASLVRAGDFSGFDESLRRCQDWDLWLNLVLNANCRGRYVNKPLFHYRIHNESITRREDRDRAVWYIKRKYGLGMFAKIPVLRNTYYVYRALRMLRIWLSRGSG
jgi:glycosyltransferase involved in cell wall biosynthesis